MSEAQIKYTTTDLQLQHIQSMEVVYLTYATISAKQLLQHAVGPIASRDEVLTPFACSCGVDFLSSGTDPTGRSSHHIITSLGT